MADKPPGQITTMSSGKAVAIALIVIALCLIAAGFFSSMVAPTPSRSASATATSSPPTSYQVTYRVSGYRASSLPEGSLTYTNAGGDTEQRGKEALPWEKSFSARPGAFVYVSVQNAHDYGSVKCEILLNGIVVKESSSQGAYVIASCSGRL
jgi:Mycobacterium membrane protein